MIEICRDETDFHLGVADKLFDVKKNGSFAVVTNLLRASF